MKLKPGISSEMYQLLLAQMLDHSEIIYIGDTVLTADNIKGTVKRVHFDGVMMAEMDDAKYILDVQGKRHYAKRRDIERISQTPENKELEDAILEELNMPQ